MNWPCSGRINRNANRTWTPGSTTRSSPSSSMSSRSTRCLRSSSPPLIGSPPSARLLQRGDLVGDALALRIVRRREAQELLIRLDRELLLLLRREQRAAREERLRAL